MKFNIGEFFEILSTSFSGMFTVHFHKIKNNNVQQMHLNTFVIYIYDMYICVYNT